MRSAIDVHLADRLRLPAPTPRGGTAGARIIRRSSRSSWHTALPTVAHVDLTDANLRDCDRSTDIALVEAAWLEARGDDAAEWTASLVRPDLDDITERSLPEGVELRAVQPGHPRAIFDAQWEAFRVEWDFREHGAGRGGLDRVRRRSAPGHLAVEGGVAG